MTLGRCLLSNFCPRGTTPRADSITHVFASRKSTIHTQQPCDCQEKLHGLPPRLHLESPSELQQDYKGYLAHKRPPTLGPCSRPMPGALWWSYGDGDFLRSRYPCRREPARPFGWRSSGSSFCSDPSNVYHRFSEEHIFDFRCNIYTHLASTRAPAPRLRFFFYITLESRVE